MGVLILGFLSTADVSLDGSKTIDFNLANLSTPILDHQIACFYTCYSGLFPVFLQSIKLMKNRQITDNWNKNKLPEGGNNCCLCDGLGLERGVMDVGSIWPGVGLIWLPDIGVDMDWFFSLFCWTSRFSNSFILTEATPW